MGPGAAGAHLVQTREFGIRRAHGLPFKGVGGDFRKIGTMDNEQLRQFVKQGLGTREVLQAVEDALIDAGYDDFVVVTDRGSFRWMTVERARRREEKEPD